MNFAATDDSVKLQALLKYIKTPEKPRNRHENLI